MVSSLGRRERAGAAAERARAAPAVASASGRDRVLADDHRVGDLGDLVGRHAGVLGVLADRLGAEPS